MSYDPNKHHRRSIRLPGYDYAQPGAYFVTLCTEERACVFGEVVKEGMLSNDAGRMIESWWHKLPAKFSFCHADTFVVMPNHVHGIIVLHEETVGADPRVRPALPRIMQWFKTMTTNVYIRGVANNGWLAFPGRLWQRNYYDHIVRDDGELERIRHYITNNPLRWETDPDNILAVGGHAGSPPRISQPSC